MRAVRFHKTGGPEELVCEDVPDPVPGEGRVLVDVRAIGVNFADTRFRRGEYFVRPNFPQIVGMEAAGEIAGTGERVMVLGANACAEKMVAFPATMFPMPDGLDFAEAAALPVQGLTAHHVLVMCGRLRAGDRVLVHAGAGGVGSLAIQLAKARGAKQVIATASSEEKLALCRSLGADVAIDYKTSDFAPAVREATGGAGVDVILEMLGGTEVLKKNLACLAPFGRIVVYGAASGDTHGTIEPVQLMPKNASVIGYYLTAVLARRDLCAPALAEIASLVVEKKLRVVIGQTFPLERAADAHRAMEERRTTGKIVLNP